MTTKEMIGLTAVVVMLSGCGGGSGNVKPDEQANRQLSGGPAAADQKGPEKSSDSFADAFGNAFNKVSGRILGKGTLKETGLYELFKDKQDPKAGWPRVAITIHRLIPNAYKQVGLANVRREQRNASELCMTYSAVLWMSAKEKREIPQQEYCASETYGKKFSYYGLALLNWGGSPLRGGGSGVTRTAGPLWPATALPPGSDYVNFTGSEGAVPLFFLLRMMDFDPQKASFLETRVWVVSMPGEAEDRPELKLPFKR